MKKTTKLAIRKVTLRDLDDPKLDKIAGGATITCATHCPPATCLYTLCATCVDTCA